MTKQQQKIVANLHAADIFLRNAMVHAGTMVARDGIDAMRLVTNDIRDAEFCLDDAIARVEAWRKTTSKKKLRKNLTSACECVRM